MAFTDFEFEQLQHALLQETRRCAVTLGMKKTSVEQLTRAVGIAKGSFYKFYKSKEILFFAVLEGIHSELFGVADRVMSDDGGLPPSERAAKAILAVCKRLSETGDMVFIENDAKKMMQSCYYRDCRRTSKRSIITMMKRTFENCWRSMTLRPKAALPWRLRRCAD